MLNHGFNPNNPIIQLCMKGMFLMESGNSQEADGIYQKAWNEASDDYEKFLVSYFMAKYQPTPSDRLEWFKTALQFALQVDDIGVKSAIPSLFADISQCYASLNDLVKAKENDELSVSSRIRPIDGGPFYHGTKADLKVGDMLLPGGASNYKPDLIMNHIYFTAIIKGAGLAAALAQGDGKERVYLVEPTGDFEDDPNVTDKRFPGNLTRSYRSLQPLRIIGEMEDWQEQSPEELAKWREKLAQNKGEIIN